MAKFITGKECNEFEISTLNLCHFSCRCFRNGNMYNSTTDVWIIVDKPLKTKGNYNSNRLFNEIKRICAGF